MKPVLPGQTIQTNMWLLNENEKKKQEEYTVYFECKVVETQMVVIGSGAYVKLHDIKLNKKGDGKKKEEQPLQQQNNDVSFACEPIFKEVESKLKKNPEIAKSINKNFAFRVSRQEKTKVFGKNFSAIVSIWKFFKIKNQKLKLLT